MKITVDTDKLAEFIFEHLTGDCGCRTLCNKYCENHSTCIESIELCLIDEFEKESEEEE